MRRGHVASAIGGAVIDDDNAYWPNDLFPHRVERLRERRLRVPRRDDNRDRDAHVAQRTDGPPTAFEGPTLALTWRGMSVPRHERLEIPVLLGPCRGHRFSTRGVRGSVAVALGRYEWPVVRFLRAHLAAANVFFDIGAHTGYFTRLALRTMPDGLIVAFEPDDALHQELAGLGGRVILRREGVGRADGAATLLSAPQRCSWLDGADSPPALRSPSRRITVRSVDSLLDEGAVPAPDVLKIDVEGSELDVLTGCERTIEHVRALAVECHSMPLFRDVLDQTIRVGFDQIQTTSGGDGVGPPTILASRSQRAPARLGAPPLLS